MTPRLKALARRLHDVGVDALVVTDLVNIRYLCGFKGSYGTLIASTEGATFITDSRYAEIAAGMVRGAKVVVQPMTGIDEFFSDFHKAAGFKSLAFEGSVSVDELEVLKKRARASKAKLEKHSSLVKSLRAVKDEDEIKIIAKAAKVADKMMEAAWAAIKPGVRESDIARVVRHAAEDLGAEGTSFESIIASGPNSSRPHHRPSDRKIKKGDMVTVDLGALVDGYCSDLTRNPVLGKPHKDYEKIYGVCLEAQEAAVKAITAGMTGGEVDAIARDIIESKGYGKQFGHGLGHSVGLEIHENPRLRKGSTEVLEAGNVVTIEPGIYVPGFGGVRIEDLLVVTNGKPKVLSRSPKQLMVLPA